MIIDGSTYATGKLINDAFSIRSIPDTTSEKRFSIRLAVLCGKILASFASLIFFYGSTQ